MHKLIITIVILVAVFFAFIWFEVKYPQALNNKDIDYFANNVYDTFLFPIQAALSGGRNSPNSTRT